METEATYRSPRLGVRGYAAIGLLGFLFCICSLLGACTSRVEVMRATSPNKNLRASVYEINGGATTDFAYEVDIAYAWPVHWDHAVAHLYGAGRNDCAYGVNIRWAGNDTLFISYKDAKSSDVKQSAQILGRTVRIITKAGVSDLTAACGGMDYGQQGKLAIIR